MARIVRARYENGVLKPLEKLDLEEVAKVLEGLPRGKIDLLEAVEELYREEMLR